MASGNTKEGYFDDIYSPKSGETVLPDFLRGGPGAAKNSFGRIFPDEAFETFRQNWRDGAPLSALFTDSPFEIRGRVARDGQNNRDDVAKLQALLGKANRLNLDAQDGPTGYFTLPLDRALKEFQVDQGLTVDGAANPYGETMQAFKSTLDDDAEPRRPFQSWEPAAPEVDEDTLPERTITMRPAPTSIFPVAALTQSVRDTFTARTGFGLESRDGRVTLLHPRTGRQIANLPESLAEELVAHWDDYSDRVQLLMLIDRRDIAPEEILRIADRLLKKVDPALYGADGSRVGVARGGANVRYGRARDRVNATWHAFRDAVQSVEFGDPRKTAVLGLQVGLFPELYKGRAVREIAMDLIPVLGNIRSFQHLMNDAGRFGDAWDDKDLAEMAQLAGMMGLDLVGVLPGGQVLKGLGRGATKTIPYAAGVAAEIKFYRAGRQFENLNHKLDMKSLFGDGFGSLSPEMRKRIRLTANNVYGNGSEKYFLSIAQRLDDLAHKPGHVKVAKGAEHKSGIRYFDLVRRRLPDVLLDDLRFGYAKYTGKARPKPRAGTHYEIKTGAAVKSDKQNYADDWLRRHPEEAAAQGVENIRDVRVLPKDLPIEFVLDDMNKRFDSMVKEGILNRVDADSMLDALKRTGQRAIRPRDYVGLIAQIAATGFRNGEGLGDELRRDPSGTAAR